MLKNIRLHLEKDEEKQKELEKVLAQNIIETHHKNINSFDRNMPSLSALIKKPQLQNYSLFCNKFGDINIVDYGVGRTLYGFHPPQEISRQVAEFNARAPYVSLSATENKHLSVSSERPSVLNLESSEGYQKHLSLQPAPDTIDCLVILGCGLGLHILELMQTKHIKYLIIYEPEVQYFQCSILVTKWSEIFELAKEKGTKIFLQVEKDGRNLVSDINELIEYEKITDFYLFQHYNHPVFNSLFKDLSSKPWAELKDNGITFSFNQNYNHYVPTWTPGINIQDYTSCDPDSERFNNNLNAFKKYFPNIYSEYKAYKPKVWIPVQGANGQINVVKADSLTPWYSDEPKQDCLYNYENYNEQPHKDGLVLGYKGIKLAHYLHYQFVKETEKILAEAESEEEVGALPEHIVSIIMFGLGVGYQLDALLENHSVEKLFICEPNTDFFYASLFAIDWQLIFETVDNTNARIYLNVGDDGTHLFRDLLNQFYAIGPYILNNTYFYQSYYNASLNSAIAQLRDQLQIVISMGEYFDHAYYGIEHTKEGFRKNIPVLSKNPSSKLTYDDKEVPVFIVGNGPSLDLSIEAIKEWREQAIVVSCGTALQALHRNGITPDFHAEIEQNRSTYDWAILTGDLEYLKKITLISANGIHPDTCGLYKDILIAFKEGESSTVSALSVLGLKHFEVIQHAFPTVSNFVTNLISVIGFNHIYFMGVDLGFVDVKHHHSKSSGYYQENGKETFDYSENSNTSLIVPGNFRPTVNTKHEFKISRQIIEQVTRKKPKQQNFYNCSDGAKISGTTPLLIDNLLIVSSDIQKQHALERLKQAVFSTEHNANFIERFESKFSHSLLIKELTSIEQLLKQEISTTEQANNLINKQKEMLFATYQNGHSLLFYYLYGTSNYANAVLSKLIFSASNSDLLSNSFQQTKNKWTHTLSAIKQVLSIQEPDNFDVSSFYIMKREIKSLELNCGSVSLLIATDSKQFKESVKLVLNEHFSWIKKVEVISPKQLENFSGTPDYAIYHMGNLQNLPVRGRVNTIITVKSEAEITAKYAGITCLNTPAIENKTVFDNPILLAKVAIISCLSAHKCDLIIPKYRALKSTTLGEQLFNLGAREYVAFDNFFYVYLFFKNNKQQSRDTSISGTRASKIFGPLKIKNLLSQLMDDADFCKHKQQYLDLVNAKSKESELD